MSPLSDASYPADVRAALLAAAHSELLEHGVGGLSLRAIAARAGVSRATPKWHFGDRAGLLTGVAIQGFDRLGAELRATAVDRVPDLAARFTALGRTYLDFGLANPALFDLMFRSDELNQDDPALVHAQRASFSVLVIAATDMSAGDDRTPFEPDGDSPAAVEELPLLAWACAHGLVILVRGGALQALTGLPTADQVDVLAYRLVDSFTRAAQPLTAHREP